MEAMDPRHLELYDQLKPTLGDEPARRLVRALPPGPDLLLTKQDLAAFEARMDARFAGVEAGFAGIDTRFAQMEATLTRRMYAAMGAWTLLLGTAFTWATALLR